MDMVFCRGCATEIHSTAIACPSCGAPQVADNTGGDKESTPWSGGAYTGLLLLSFFFPIFGLIYGPVKSGKATKGSKRKSQATHYLYAGIAGIMLNLIIMAG